MFNKIVKNETTGPDLRKKDEDRKNKENSRRLGIRAVLIPFILAVIVVTLIRLFITESTAGKTEYRTILIAAKEIPAHTYIKAGEEEEYFKEVLCNPDILPEGVMTQIDFSDSSGVYVISEMEENEMLLSSNVRADDPALRKYEDGYHEASFSCSSFHDCVNGAVRKGDIIDIYAVNPATGEPELMLEDVYVKEAYDSNGDATEDSEDTATAFTVWITDKEEAMFNRTLAYGDISVRR